MPFKPDRGLLYYAFCAVFLILCGITAAAAILLSGVLSAVISVICASLFVISSVYLTLTWYFTEYTVCDTILEIKTGVVFRRTIFVYIGGITAVYKVNFPFGCGLSIIKVPGSGTVVLTDKLQIRRNTTKQR